MNPGFEEKLTRASERVRETVEWTGKTAEVDMEETGYSNYYLSKPRPLNYYLVSVTYYLFAS